MINYILAVAPFPDDPMILVFGAGLAIALMIMSRMWKARIYSIISTAVWLFMMMEVAEYTPLVIACIALMAEELYHAFIAEA